MIPIEQLKESSFYQLVLQEGERKGEKRGEKKGERRGEIKGAAESLTMMVAKRFPNLNVSAEIKRIQNAALLQQLCVELLDMPSADVLKKRLSEILSKNKRTSAAERKKKTRSQ
ncbi:MAG: hypothetical protein AB1757_00695 [Acidobacteriota bacterium]